MSRRRRRTRSDSPGIGRREVGQKGAKIEERPEVGRGGGGGDGWTSYDLEDVEVTSSDWVQRSCHVGSRKHGYRKSFSLENKPYFNRNRMCVTRRDPDLFADWLEWEAGDPYTSDDDSLFGEVDLTRNYPGG